MTDKKDVSEKELDEASDKAIIAIQAIGNARVACQLMGVPPASWMLALIQEMGAVIVSNGSEDGALTAVLKGITDAVAEMQDPEVAKQYATVAEMGSSVIRAGIVGIVGLQPGDETDELLARTIGRAGK